jgi:hypothetical protein
MSAEEPNILGSSGGEACSALTYWGEAQNGHYIDARNRTAPRLWSIPTRARNVNKTEAYFKTSILRVAVWPAAWSLYR